MCRCKTTCAVHCSKHRRRVVTIAANLGGARVTRVQRCCSENGRALALPSNDRRASQTWRRCLAQNWCQFDTPKTHSEDFCVGVLLFEAIEFQPSHSKFTTDSHASMCAQWYCFTARRMSAACRTVLAASAKLACPCPPGRPCLRMFTAGTLHGCCPHAVPISHSLCSHSSSSSTW